MSKTVIALFDNIGRAQDAIDALLAKGFSGEEIYMHTGEEFARQAELPPPEHDRGLWQDVKRFLDEVGITNPAPPPEHGDFVIERDDALVLLETSDDRADDAADTLDRQGAVDIEARKKAGPVEHRASGLEPQTSGRTPPDLREVPPQGDIDERAMASGGTAGARRKARVYDRSTAPRGNWTPTSPTRH